MTGAQRYPFINPVLEDVLTLWKRDIFATLHAVKIGEIVKFDRTKKTAEVKILAKRVLADKSVKAYPLLVDVPVVTLQGGGASVQLPIAAGDQCLVFFADRNLDAWFKTGTDAAPFDGRCHDLSDGIAFVGVNALTSDLHDYVADQLSIRNDGAELTLKDGKVGLANATTDLRTLLDGLVDILIALTDANNVAMSAASIAALTAYKIQLQALLR